MCLLTRMCPNAMCYITATAPTSLSLTQINAIYKTSAFDDTVDHDDAMNANQWIVLEIGHNIFLQIAQTRHRT